MSLRLGFATWQYYCQWTGAMIIAMIFAGVFPVTWLAARLGHKLVIPIWKDPLWGPILVAWCLVLYSLLLAVIAIERRRHFLAVYERGFCLSGTSVAYEDIREVRIGRNDGTVVSTITRLNACIPLPQNRGAAQLMRNSAALSLTLVMNDGRVMPLTNFFAAFPIDALSCVARGLEDNLSLVSPATADGESR